VFHIRKKRKVEILFDSIPLGLAILVAIFGEKLEIWHWRWKKIHHGPILAVLPILIWEIFVIIRNGGDLIHPMSDAYLLVLIAGGMYFLSASTANLLKLEASPLTNTLICLISSLLSIVLTSGGSTALCLSLLLGLNKKKSIPFTAYFFIALVNGVAQGPAGDGPGVLAFKEGVSLQFFAEKTIPMGLLIALLGSALIFVINSFEISSGEKKEERVVENNNSNPERIEEEIAVTENIEATNRIGLEHVVLAVPVEVSALFLEFPTREVVCIPIIIAAVISGKLGRKAEPTYETAIPFELGAILVSLLLGVEAAKALLVFVGNNIASLPTSSSVSYSFVVSVLTLITDNAAAFEALLKSAEVSNPGQTLGTISEIITNLLWFSSSFGGGDPIANYSTLLGFGILAKVAGYQWSFWKFTGVSFALYVPLVLLVFLAAGPYQQTHQLGSGLIFVFLVSLLVVYLNKGGKEEVTVS
jgi:hypothetical protein